MPTPPGGRLSRRRELARRPIPAAALLLVLSACAHPAPPLSPNVLLITIDTLRADHLGAYGYDGASTPNLDALAAGGTMFRDATTAVPITLPSHASLMTGLLPPAGGVRSNGSFRLRPEVETLGERLRASGRRTGAVVAADVLAGAYGLNQGFSAYRDDVEAMMNRPGTGRRASEVTDLALDLVRGGEAPWFVWAHYFDPHLSYDPPPPFDRQFAGRPYDGEIAYVDREVGRLLRGAKAAGGNRPLIVIVTADHGEGLGEHGEEAHGIFLYQTTLHVPLILAGAGVPAARVIEEPVRLVDVLPTLLELLRLPAASAVDGRSLVPLLRGAALPAAPSYAESLYGELHFGWSPLTVLRSGDWKLVRAPIPELFNLRDDPGERRNLAPEQPERVAEMRRRLEELEASLAAAPGGPEGSRRSLDREERQRLASLGYVGAGTPRVLPAGKIGPDPKTRLDRLARVEAFNDALLEGRVDDAIAGLREFLVSHPDSAFANLALADALFSLGRATEASQVFAHLVTLVPDDHDTRLQYATSLLKERRFPEAAAQLREALRIFPDSAEAEGEMGVALAGLGDAAGARRHLERALTLSPALPEAHLQLAEVLQGLGEPGLAEAHLRQALELRPYFPAARVRLGLLLMREGRTEGARAALSGISGDAMQDLAPAFERNALPADAPAAGASR